MLSKSSALSPLFEREQDPSIPFMGPCSLDRTQGSRPFLDRVAVVQRPQGRRGWAAGLTGRTERCARRLSSNARTAAERTVNSVFVGPWSAAFYRGCDSSSGLAKRILRLQQALELLALVLGACLKLAAVEPAAAATQLARSMDVTRMPGLAARTPQCGTAEPSF